MGQPKKNDGNGSSGNALGFQSCANIFQRQEEIKFVFALQLKIKLGDEDG